MSNTRKVRPRRDRPPVRRPFVPSIVTVPCIVCGDACPVPAAAARRVALGDSFVVCEGCLEP